MKTLAIYVVLSLILVLGLGCATAHPPSCDRITCSPAQGCVDRANLSLDHGQVEDAICYARRALALRSDSPEARLSLGVALTLAGDTIGAKKQFTWVVANAPNEVMRADAHDWLAVFSSPLPVAVFYDAAKGCDAVSGIDSYAGVMLLRSLKAFPAVRVLEGAPDHLERGVPVNECAYAARLGASVAIIVGTRCGQLEVKSKHDFLGGTIQLSGVTSYRANVELDVRLESAADCRSEDTLRASATRSWMSRKHAYELAVDASVNQLMPKLYKVLLFGGVK